MINLDFALRNPFSDRCNCVLNKSGMFSTFKAWEFNVYKTNDLVKIGLAFTVRGDHAGLCIEMGLLGYNVEFHQYDTRHWNYEQGCWHVYKDTTENR